MSARRSGWARRWWARVRPGFCSRRWPAVDGGDTCGCFRYAGAERIDGDHWPCRELPIYRDEFGDYCRIPLSRGKFAKVDPDDFARWVFPHLFHSRLPRYDSIARLGYTVTSEEVNRVKNDTDFERLLEIAIERQPEDDD